MRFLTSLSLAASSAAALVAPAVPCITQHGDPAMDHVALPDSEVRGPVDSIGIDRDRLYHQTSGTSTWTRGRTYKAEASPSGFTYIPFLGSGVPRNFPVSFRLESAALGSREIELNDVATVSCTGDRAVLDRGPVEVIYDFAVDSVEQSFALEVAGEDSDLTLVLDVSTELGASAHGGGFSFDNEWGGMRYGAATVLDGAGRSSNVAADLQGSRLTLTVPASFLRMATGPILVDPIFVTFAVDEAAGYQLDVDVTYQAGTDRFLYVYEDQFSGSDVDIYATDIQSNGTVPRGDYMDFSAEDWTDPSAATVNFAGIGLAVARRDGPGGNSIAGRRWNFSTGSFEAGILDVRPPTTFSTVTQPDVGGSWGGTAGARFAVVWSERFPVESDARGRVVLADGSFTNTIALDSSPDYDSTEVCISESTGNPATVNKWNVAWINRRLANNEYTVEVTQLRSNGAIDFPHFPVETLPIGDSIGEIDVSDSIIVAEVPLPVYAVAYDVESPLRPEQDTFILFVEGGAPIKTVELQRSEHADLALDQAEARLSSSADKFVVSYLEPSAAGTQYNGFITAFDFTEGEFLSISERRFPIGTVGAPTSGSPYTPRGGLALASRASGGLSSSQYFGVGYEVGIGSEADVAGLVYWASNGYSPAFQYCYGNPNSTGDRGFIRMSGSRSTTSTKELIATALPNNAFGYFVVGTSSTTSVNPGGSAGVLCVGGTIGRYLSAIASTGSTGSISIPFDPQQIPQPGGLVMGMTGEFWQFALWHRDSAGGSTTSNFTNAISILFE